MFYEKKESKRWFRSQVSEPDIALLGKPRCHTQSTNQQSEKVPEELVK